MMLFQEGFLHLLYQLRRPQFRNGLLNYRPVVTCLRKMPAEFVLYTGVMVLAKFLQLENGNGIHRARHDGSRKRVQWILAGLFQSCTKEPPDIKPANQAGCFTN